MKSLMLFADDVVVRRVPIEIGTTTTLFPSEVQAIEGASPQRRREFAAGRSCARSALAELGLEPCCIPVGARGMPVWPAGAVGSITHDGAQACAAVAEADAYRSIGIDVTDVGGVTDDLAPLICGDGEITRPPGLPATVDYLGLLFSAKESIYKCFYPLDRTFLDFEEVVVEWGRCEDDRHGAFRAVFRRRHEAWTRSDPVVGRWSMDRDRIYTSASHRNPAARLHDRGRGARTGQPSAIDTRRCR